MDGWMDGGEGDMRISVCVGLKDLQAFKAVVLSPSPLPPPSPLPACPSVKASPVTFQAAELRDLPVSPSVVISDCYSPDNDALAPWGDNDVQQTSRSAWLKVVFPLLHQTVFCWHTIALDALMKTKRGYFLTGT